MNVSLQMKEDQETDKAFGWVLEMSELSFVVCDLINAFSHCYVVINPVFCYFSLASRYAYAVASALHGVQHILRKDFMIQVLKLFLIF